MDDHPGLDQMAMGSVSGFRLKFITPCLLSLFRPRYFMHRDSRWRLLRVKNKPTISPPIYLLPAVPIFETRLEAKWSEKSRSPVKTRPETRVPRTVPPWPLVPPKMAHPSQGLPRPRPAHRSPRPPLRQTRPPWTLTRLLWHGVSRCWTLRKRIGKTDSVLIAELQVTWLNASTMEPPSLKPFSTAKVRQSQVNVASFLNR